MVFAEEQAHKTELSSTTDINMIGLSCEAELFEDLDQRDLEFLQCKDDTLPRGLEPLKEMFDFNDVGKKPKIESTENDVEEYNIGSPKEPKMIKISKNLPPHIKQRYIELFKKFKDVFVWGMRT